MSRRNPEQIVAALREAAAEDRIATTAKAASASRLRKAIAAAVHAGLSHREIAPHVGLSYQRVGQLAPRQSREAK